MQRFEAIDPIYFGRRFPSNTIHFVWYNSSIDDTNDFEESFRKTNFDLDIFNDIGLCISATEKLHREECKTILFISSSLLTKQLVPEVISNVHSIFVISKNKLDDQDLLEQPKVSIVSDSPVELIDAVNKSLKNLKNGYVNEDEQESLRNLEQEKARFLWFNMFRNVTGNLHQTNEAKCDLIRCLKQYFCDSNEQLKRVEKFADTYTSKKVFYWYTQPRFISDVINIALRSIDIDALFDLRYFIIDLCQLLNENRLLHRELTVYRGVLMDKEKFEIMKSSVNRKDLISMRGFLSTARFRHTTEPFFTNSNNDPNKIEVIYEIYVSSDLEHIVYADISAENQFEGDEILFDVDSTFEFDSIDSDPENENRFIVKLKATDRGWSLAQKFVSFNSQELITKSPEILFGELLIDMGEYDKAMDYFQRLLNRENAQVENAFVLTNKTRSIILNNLGHSCCRKGNLEEAMKHFDAALELQEMEPELEPLRAFTLNNKAVILMGKGNYEAAYAGFQCAVDIIMKQHKKDDISHILGNMGTIKDILGEYEEALSLHQQAYEALRHEGVHDKHQYIATNKMNIAFVYLNQARWTEAEEVLNQAKEIYEYILPGAHYDKGRVLFCLGVVLRSQGKFDEALEHFQRAINVYEKVYGKLHPHIAETYNSIANVNSVQEKYEDALVHYQNAYEQYQQLYQTDNNASVGRVINNIGQVYRKLNRFVEALDHLEKALVIRQNTLGHNHPDVATTLVNISLVYRAQNNFDRALDYAKRGLIIRREKLPVNNEDLIETEQFVSELEKLIVTDTEVNGDPVASN